MKTRSLSFNHKYAFNSYSLCFYLKCVLLLFFIHINTNNSLLAQCEAEDCTSLLTPCPTGCCCDGICNYYGSCCENVCDVCSSNWQHSWCNVQIQNCIDNIPCGQFGDPGSCGCDCLCYTFGDCCLNVGVCNINAGCTDPNACNYNPNATCSSLCSYANDNNPCTTDQCVNGSPVFTPINCNDNNPCTNDICVNGNCQYSVNDNIPPTAKCKSIVVNLPAEGVVTISAGQIDNGSSDNCDTNLSMSLNTPTFSCNNTGVNPITLTVTDNAFLTHSCNATVTVTDNNSICCSAPTLAVNNIVNVSCPGYTNGFVELGVTGGVGMLTYLWAPGNSTAPNLLNVAAGTYSVTITADNNPDCSAVLK